MRRKRDPDHEARRVLRRNSTGVRDIGIQILFPTGFLWRQPFLFVGGVLGNVDPEIVGEARIALGHVELGRAVLRFHANPRTFTGLIEGVREVLRSDRVILKRQQYPVGHGCPRSGIQAIRATGSGTPISFAREPTYAGAVLPFEQRILMIHAGRSCLKQGEPQAIPESSSEWEKKDCSQKVGLS